MLWQLTALQSQLEFQEQSMVDKSLVSRQEAKIRELETKLEFEKTQVKRLEVSGQDKLSACVMLFCEKVSLQIIRGKKIKFYCWICEKHVSVWIYGYVHMKLGYYLVSFESVIFN